MLQANRQQALFFSLPKCDSARLPQSPNSRDVSQNAQQLNGFCHQVPDCQKDAKIHRVEELRVLLCHGSEAVNQQKAIKAVEWLSKGLAAGGKG